MNFNSTQSKDHTKPNSGIPLLALIGLGLASSFTMTGCIAAAAAAGAGAGYAVGHEQGEDHVSEGIHEDDD